MLERGEAETGAHAAVVGRQSDGVQVLAVEGGDGVVERGESRLAHQCTDGGAAHPGTSADVVIHSSVR